MRTRLRLLLGVALLALAGCQATPSQPAAAEPAAAKRSPVLQRMMQAYPDLAGGRFISVADFETPGHVQLFRITDERGKPRDNADAPTLSILRSRNETGAGSLKFTLRDPQDALHCDSESAEAFALARDWRPYGLLLMSLHAPADGVVVEVAVRSGVEQPLTWTRSLLLRSGWNLIRLDTATIGERVDLADVRRITWRVRDASDVELYLDDLILADNTEYSLGRDAPDGELYAFTRGTRQYAGVRGRFEVAWADGVLTRVAGPEGENLADAGGLGPWPVPLASDWRTSADVTLGYDDPNTFAAWGASVVASQRIVEASPMRLVVEGQWRFVDADALARDALDTRPGHTWRYTVYSHGAMYIRLTSTTGGAEWPTPLVGCLLALDGRREARVISPSGGDAAFFLATRAGSARGDVLWAWAAPSVFENARVLESADDRRIALVVGAAAAAPTIESAHLLRLWPADIDSAVEAGGFAADYQNPASTIDTTDPAAASAPSTRPRARVGRVITDAPGDLNQDGFNESEGCYEFGIDQRVLRIEFDTQGVLRFDPLFRVHGTQDHPCWIYLRGRSVSDQGRDGDNLLLFRIPRLGSGVAGIEVHAKAPANPE